MDTANAEKIIQNTIKVGKNEQTVNKKHCDVKYTASEQFLNGTSALYKLAFSDKVRLG